MKLFTKKVFLLALVACSSQLAAAESNHFVASQLVTKQLKEELIDTLIEVQLIEARKSGVSSLSLTRIIPAKSYADLGMLVKPSKKAAGFEVVSISKLGMGADLGLKRGDVITSVNGVAVASAKKPNTLWQVEVGDSISLEYLSNGNLKTASTTVPGVKLPQIKIQVGG
ncbi:PDZ domain-containing protein [Pseudoalteromonas sp. SSM20]|uniref:PDZ domain-containing protein n=1 Tax=Pseudoalteromonas sp. SSM20 TaxID=3139394 RepID=UPI003BA93C24